MTTATIAMALGSIDAEDRRQATAELGRVPLDEALPLLLLSLGDEDWRVRKEATLVARSFGGAPTLLSALVKTFLGGDNVGLRNAAVDVLAGAGHAATAALCEALPRLDADGRKLAVETLGRGRDPEALPALTAALDDSDDNVRQGAIEAVAALGSLARERVAPVLMSRLDDRDRLVRLTALKGLTALEVAIPWARLAPLLDEPTLRPAALSAAALAGSPDAARALAEALPRTRGSAFEQALRALARLAEGPLAPAIAEALRRAGPELGRHLIAVALGGGHGGRPSPTGGAGGLAARSSGDDGEGIARRGMALRLAALAGAPGVVDAAVSGLAEDLLAEPAQAALTALGASALPALFERLADTAVPSDARAALVDVIADLLDGELRESARQGGRPPAALGALRGAARDPDRQVAVRAIRAIARLGDESDLLLCAEQTLDPARPVAVAAEGALGALAARFPVAARAFADRVARDETYLLPAAIVIGALGAAAPFEDRDAIFLAHAATAGDTRARRAAVEAVSALRAEVGSAYPAALEVLSFALTDEEHEVQTAAARALGRLCSAPDAPRPGDVLDLVDRSGAADLVATAVRAIGEGMSAAASRRQPSPELVSALALLVRSAQSPVAIAAVDALAHAHRVSTTIRRSDAEGPSTTTTILDALAGALGHPDEDVVKAALLKLAATGPAARASLAGALEHGSAAVRDLATEILADLRETGG
jgi:HEAT repeat protein